MIKQTNFSLTGFKDSQEQDKVKQSLISLGCNLIQKLAQATNILIVDGTWTQKFKIAQLHKNPIPCVSRKWAQDSKKKKTLLPPDKYLITEKQMFLGTNVALCGFTQEKLQKLQKIIKEKKGNVITTYKAAQIIRRHEAIPQIIDVILASNDQIQRAKHAKIPSNDQLIPPLVRIEWLEDSIKRKRCKFPEDYAVNRLVQKVPIMKNYGKLSVKLRNFLEIDIMEKSGDFLQDTLIFIDKELNMDFVKLLKNLIAICGGYWTDVFSSSVTHVLVSFGVDETKLQYYKKYGNRIYILRPQWLVDSMLLYNRVPEQDYFIRSFKIKEKLFEILLKQAEVRNNQNSLNFNSMPQMGQQKFPYSSKTLPNIEIKRQKSIVQPKSSIFNGRNFYFPPEICQDPEYQDIRKLIINAGGCCYSKINSRMQVFVILKDSPKNKQIIQNIQKNKYNCKILSERWIKESIKKNQFIKPDKSYHIYEAFNFNTPIPDFHRFTFEIVGYDEPVKVLRIKELLKTLGSTKMNPNKRELTHVICGPQWEKNEGMKAIKKIIKDNKNFKLISYKWIDDCINEGKIVQESSYLINHPQVEEMKNPLVKNEDNSFENSGKKTIQTENKSDQILTP